MTRTPWLVDGHLDLAYIALSGHDLLADRPAGAESCVTLPGLRRGGVRVALATIFTEEGGDPATNPCGYRSRDELDEAELAGRRQLDVYERLERAGDVRIVRGADDLPAEAGDRDGGPLRVVLLMECADPIRDADHAAWWVERGVRAVGLAWARGSRFAGGNGAPGPITPAGRDLVEALDKLGVIHDASHLSDEGFDNLMTLARGPIVASHSNARAITGDSQRHLADSQIAAIGRRGGVVGLNLFGKFLCRDRRATIDDCVAHVEHAAAIMGHRLGVALGSDMDGGFGPAELPVGLESPDALPALIEALRSRGWSDDDCAGFAHGNWMRVLGEALRVRRG